MATARKENQNKSELKAESIMDDVKAAIKTDGLSGFIGSGSRIVFRAAGILEEEIARGIIAAKQIEEKFTDVPKMRSGNGALQNRQMEDLLVRFRKDAHDIIDLVIDFAAIAANNVERISSQLINIKQGSTAIDTPSQPSAPAQMPMIQVPKDLKPGEQAEIPLVLENDNRLEAKVLEFVNTVFTDTAGNQLPSTILTYTPNPLTIAPASKGTVKVKLSVPATAKAGSYTGFLQAKNVESLKAAILLKIV